MKSKIKQAEVFHNLEKANNAELEKTITHLNRVVADAKTELKKAELACTDMRNEVRMLRGLSNFVNNLASKISIFSLK